ncbi:hypothetical protein [Fulvivirga lutimaris]|uniref:hypothetical protein n=1 Tax=Fulvivirga lutimaris TaxID=1819566 RepID=UPI0012BBD398|nr:hypothetical protein [Fulvivirga lutimaris]MTI39903.1 hypothetical protein [Fulvivirga lutimaris]
MKVRFSIIILFLALTSCFDAPEFDTTPKIEYSSVKFKDVGTNSDADSLIIFLNFEDGDGDLGLGTEELNPPFNQKIYFSNKTGQAIDLFNSFPLEDLMVLSNRSSIDTLPAFSGAPKCFNWDTNPELFLNNGDRLKDTVYFQFNPRHYNIFVDFFVEDGGSFRKFDWRLEIDCSTNFDGRFPILNDGGKEKGLEGTLKYGMVSLGFKSIFQDNLMKLKVTILDRNGNYSNTIETPPFRLSEID